jgi:predicted metal-dependent phosphoesterase TrpH
MLRVDLHVHTNKSDGAGTVEQTLAAASSKPKLWAVAITDHNEISGALEAAKLAKKFRVQVIIGEEISTDAGHILGLFLKKFIPPGLTPEETIRLIHQQGGLAIVPHPALSPLPHYRGITMKRLDLLAKRRDELERPDGVEVRNGLPLQLALQGEIKSRNIASWGLAEVGGSDSHHPSSIGSCWTEFSGSSLEDLVTALRKRQTRAMGEGWSVWETARALTIDIIRRFQRRFRRNIRYTKATV